MIALSVHFHDKKPDPVIYSIGVTKHFCLSIQHSHVGDFSFYFDSIEQLEDLNMKMAIAISKLREENNS